MAPVGFRGSLRSLQPGTTVLTEINSDPHTVQRTEELIHGGDNAFFKISFQTSGQGLLIRDGREVVLKPGTLAIYDTSRPYTPPSIGFFQSCPDIPPQRAGDPCRSGLPPSPPPLGRSVADFLNQTLPMMPHPGKPVGSQLIQNGLSLLTTVLSDILGPGDQTQDEKLNQVLAYLGENLGDPDLSPTGIARANFISLRTLHQLFEGTGTTVAATIRNRRLERCRAELADPVFSQDPVPLVGARWGFHDPAHFSRTFRALFGTPPGQYRHQMLD